MDLNKKDLERWKENGANDWSQKDFLFALNEIDDVIDCYFDNDDSENEQGEVLGDFKESADTCSVHREKKKKVIYEKKIYKQKYLLIKTNFHQSLLQVPY